MNEARRRVGAQIWEANQSEINELYYGSFETDYLYLEFAYSS
jgi:hypothetical protein